MWNSLSSCLTALDKILTPLKFTSAYEDGVIKVVSQAVAAARPVLFVHQLGDGLLVRKHPLEREDWLHMLRSICQSTGMKNPRFEVWFNRLIVYELWRVQYRLSRKLDETLYRPNRIRRRRYSPQETK